jgi:hypothetical protein
MRIRRASKGKKRVRYLRARFSDGSPTAASNIYARFAAINSQIYAGANICRYQEAIDRADPNIRVLVWTNGNFSDASEPFRVDGYAHNLRR